MIGGRGSGRAGHSAGHLPSSPVREGAGRCGKVPAAIKLTHCNHCGKVVRAGVAGRCGKVAANPLLLLREGYAEGAGRLRAGEGDIDISPLSRSYRSLGEGESRASHHQSAASRADRSRFEKNSGNLERLSADLDGRQLDLCRLVQAPGAPHRPGLAGAGRWQHSTTAQGNEHERDGKDGCNAGG